MFKLTRRRLHFKLFLLLFFATVLIPLFSVPSKASALTPQQEAYCQTYSGTHLLSDPLFQASVGANGNPTFTDCRNANICSTSTGSASGTVQVTCVNTTAQDAQTLQAAPAITTICGVDTRVSGYNACVTNVKKVWGQCQNVSSGSSASTNANYATNTAACIASKISGVNVDALTKALQPAITSAQTSLADQAACTPDKGTWNPDTRACEPLNNQDTEPPTCEMSPNPLSWILCPVITALIGGVDAVRDALQNVLKINIDPNSDAYKDIYSAWSQFRILGNVVLAIMVLLIIYGEVIGGGVLEAYTVKKALPRLLIGAVLINLSIYLVWIMMDITNVIGSGIYTILTAPFADGGLHRVNIDLVGGLLGNGAIAAAVGVGFAATPLFLAALQLLWTFVLLPALLIILAALFVVIVRQGIILLLLIVSPVAFALYCLPNTEKYFKKWWEELFKALLVYPIIMALFAASTMLSTIIGAANLGLATPMKMLVQLIVAIAPIALVVVAFKMAGGLMGNIMNFADNARSGAHKLGQSRRERAMNNFRGRSIEKRQDMHAGFQKTASDTTKSGLRRGAAKALGRAVGGYNIEALASAQRAADMKVMNDQIATGADAEARGLTVNKQAALARDKSGGTLWRINEETGARQFRSLGGAWVNEADVDAGHRRWGNNTFAQQAALSYEMRKANTDEDRARVAEGFNSVARASRSEGGWGMSEQQAGGAWIGAAFENQNNNLQYKYVKHKPDGTVDFDHKGFVQEVYEKRNSYGMSNMDATTIQRLTQAADSGDVPNDQLVAIAQTMQDRLAGARSGSSSIQPTGTDGAAEPSASSMGAGHVSQEMNRFVNRMLGQKPRQQRPNTPMHPDFNDRDG